MGILEFLAPRLPQSRHLEIGRGSGFVQVRVGEGASRQHGAGRGVRLWSRLIPLRRGAAGALTPRGACILLVLGLF